MFSTQKLRLLLLFEQLLLVYLSYGVANASSSSTKSTAFFRGNKLEKQKTITNGEKDKFHVMAHAGVSGVRRHKMNGIRSPIIKELPRGTLQTEVQNKRLKEEHKKRQMIAPGYYQAECSEKKPCKEGTYCNVLYCEDCHKLNVGCTNSKQCCKGTTCTFGRCEKKSAGDPGTFCEKDSECKDGCCVLEPTINSILPICKKTLEEYHQCAAILFRKIWVGEKPDCGPCKPGLECVQKGVFGSHEVCMKPD